MKETLPETEEQITSESQNELPELYSKTLILVFAILFSVIFAAALLVINLRNLDKKRAAVYVMLFSLGYLILTAVLLQLLSISPSYSFIFNVVGAAILNEFFWNKYIGREREYRKKSWIKPVLISLLIAMTFFFIVIKSLQ